MDINWLVEKAEVILADLDTFVYPESYRFLTEVLEKKQFYEIGPFEIATELNKCDRPKDWTPELVKYITDLYMYGVNTGHAPSMNDLGAMYYDGNRGFEQSFEKSMDYYKMAAEHGERQASENLGYCYYYGRDGEVDYEKAFKYFALGAFDGALTSLYKIGDMYYNGYFVEKNYYEAFAIYMRCLNEMSDEDAVTVAGPVYLRIGKMLSKGKGTDKDLRGALECFQNAERYLYSMVVDYCDYMYKGSLQAAIEGQEKVRAELAEEIPEKDWGYD